MKVNPITIKWNSNRFHLEWTQEHEDDNNYCHIAVAVLKQDKFWTTPVSARLINNKLLYILSIDSLQF